MRSFHPPRSGDARGRPLPGREFAAGPRV